jgi:hypothetical protein
MAHQTKQIGQYLRKLHIKKFSRKLVQAKTHNIINFNTQYYVKNRIMIIKLDSSKNLHIDCVIKIK